MTMHISQKEDPSGVFEIRLRVVGQQVPDTSNSASLIVWQIWQWSPYQICSVVSYRQQLCSLWESKYQRNSKQIQIDVCLTGIPSNCQSCVYLLFAVPSVISPNKDFWTDSTDLILKYCMCMILRSMYLSRVNVYLIQDGKHDILNI